MQRFSVLALILIVTAALAAAQESNSLLLWLRRSPDGAVSIQATGPEPEGSQLRLLRTFIHVSTDTTNTLRALRPGDDQPLANALNPSNPQFGTAVLRVTDGMQTQFFIYLTPTMPGWRIFADVPRPYTGADAPTSATTPVARPAQTPKIDPAWDLE